ncbi:MAG: microcystin degradation protein MlrC [Hyphomicrobiales bacterium]|nr:MAG: microcystin degradation protein MlrC [Hyphomicrobiales bacterium]
MPLRILSAEISHETNTFNINLTELQDFQDRFLLDGPAACAERGENNTELAGVLEVSRSHDWELNHVISASAGPGGRVTDEAFDHLCAPILMAAYDGGWDGILLILHGAMVSASYDDAEGEILRRLRGVVGDEIPIAVTLDPHANVSAAMCDLAQILVSFTTYPHVDMRATGIRTAELLHRAMMGDIRPVTLRAHRPMLEEASGGRTDMGPMVDRHAMARAYEAQKNIHAISINAAFPCADIAEVGPTVLITCEAQTNGARAIIEEIADDIWEQRTEQLNTYLTVEEAAAAATAWKSGAGPLVIADYADNPGSGAYGDSTALLSALLAAGIEDACFGPMIDPVIASQLQSNSVGDTVTLQLGGKTAPEFGGEPIEVSGTIQWRGVGKFVGSGPILGGQQRSMGDTVVLRVQGIDILIISAPQQLLDLSQFETFGIDPHKCRVIALKSMQHFRAAFASIAGRIIVCDSGALCTLNYARLPYRSVPRPIYPLDA